MIGSCSLGLCVCCAAAFLLLAASAGPVQAVDSSAARRLFADPPREYSSAPFWVWNDMMTREEVVATLQDFARRNIKQAFVHPRPGLMTPYLGKDWFDLWKLALQEAERLDMNLWIYDENSYPSGFAGGLVPDAMPESRGRGLAFREETKPGKAGPEVVAVFRLTEDAAENVTEKARGSEPLPEGKYLVASVARAGDSPWHGGRCYVDLLYPGVTEKFLAITLDPYQKEIGGEFGKRVPGSFTDEPEIRTAGNLPWTDDLPQQFEKRWGYRLTDHLPSLERPIGDWKRIRHNYYQTLLDLFIERWSKPYFDYCAKRKLEFTGHYWEHEWPNCVLVPDNMALYAWMQRPGIDTLMNEYDEGPNAQFGNVRAVKELSSVANQMGYQRTLCEAYGAGGWDMRLADMKRIGDWLYVLGVNTLNQHLSYVSIRGMRKRDHPPSFSYHEPWWDAYAPSAAYFERLTVALTQGEQINPVLLLEPTTTAWLYQGKTAPGPGLGEVGNTFQRLVTDIEKAQVESDIGCEDILARHGSVSGPALVVGRRQYGIIVLPPMTENLNARTVELLESFLKGGGTVLCCGDPPARVDGQLSDRAAQLAKAGSWKKVQAEALPKMLLEATFDGFAVRRSPGDKGLLFHHRRRLTDGQIVFLTNTSSESTSSGVIEDRAGGVEQWDLDTGQARPYEFEQAAAKDQIRAAFELPPCGSLLLFLSEQRRDSAPGVKENVATLAADGPPRIRRVEPNVVTLDFVDVTAGGETKKAVYVLKAADFAFKKNGMDRNPWDGAVQFRDEIISRKFPADSGFEAVYRFTIAEKVPATLAIVIERVDIYTVTCNDKPVAAKKGEWWLDRSFGRIDIAAVAVVGENVVRIKATPFTVFHELESAYLLGDFAAKPSQSGFLVTPPAELGLGPWNKQGLPLYSAGVGYSQKFDVAAPSGRYRVSLPKWYGSVAQVNVNGKPAGFVSAPPWECDVTDAVRAGANEIEVVVIGTLRNTLGPHHGNPPLGRAWPAMFQQAPESGPPPGEMYATIAYGLFEPFVLKHVTK